MTTDTGIINWLCDHATWLIIIKENGEEKCLKITGDDVSFRDRILEELE